MAFIRANGIIVHYQIVGRENAPVLIFANSLGSDFRIWQEIVPLFTDRYRIVLYDKRGHGLSDAPSVPYSVDDHAGDLLALMDHLRVEKAAVVGVSFGGMIAQRIAITEPSRIAALVLIGTAVKIGTPQSWAERIAAVEQSGIEAVADGVMQRWFTPLFREKRPADWVGWRNMMVRTPTHGYAGTCAAVRDADLTEGAARIAVPTLCIAGDQDGSTPPDLVRHTADLIRGAGFEIIKGAGHIPGIEQPDATARLIDRHLQEAGYV
jgi:3-oxoadipate enol-lactonase